MKEKQKEKFEFADLVCDAISNHRKSERKREGGKKVAFIFSRGVRAEKGREHRRQQNSVAIRGLGGGETRDENTSSSGYSAVQYPLYHISLFCFLFLVFSALLVEGKGRKVSGSVDLWIYVIAVCGGGKEDTRVLEYRYSINFFPFPFCQPNSNSPHYLFKTTEYRTPPFQQTRGKTK